MESEHASEYVSVKLPDNTIIRVEATQLGGEENVAFKLPDFEQVTQSIASISRAVVKAVDEIKPQKASVEFGIELGVESGQLTAMLIKGTGKSNLKITLEWGSQPNS